ncbi:related to methylglyoxal reductase (NADPH-dependent) [Melanopsichium pennsylvanicum]|uniref:Related to methylglyoxal reductase (NADPH-dependent) n=2 Tax=Melanopsichium pennsylvanicum TaxID=63383 RepID=A0AAJ4XQZ3_9BASI|nr:related to methylglyoxal reductase (NADPH-dependent) [Melanopsichium pennsylvanicum 4]SNX85478.1 related to methylglyoxal reductase (NADPH-dependent) [Melanopsichium pennsylvanicum]
MSNEEVSQVLLTGVSGFVGSHVLDQLLKSPRNYHVTCVIRSKVKTEPWLSRQFADAFDTRITVVEVPDLLAPGCLDAVVQGKDYLVHVASPYVLTAKNNKKDIIEPAIHMTQNVLEAALKAENKVKDAGQPPRLKRIVVTSSFAAILNPLKGIEKRDYTYTTQDWQPIQCAFMGMFHTPLAYVISKTLAEKSVWDFLNKHNPTFDATTVNPPQIYGPIIHQVNSEEAINTSSAEPWKLYKSGGPKGDGKVPIERFWSFCDVRDVAKIHVEALHNPKAKNTRYLSCGGTVSWQEVADEIHDNPQYPQQLKHHIPKGNYGQNHRPKTLAKLDTTRAQHDLGIEFKDWKESVIKGSLYSLIQIEKSWSR